MTDTVANIAVGYVILTSIIHLVTTKDREQVDVKRFRIVAITSIAMALLYIVK